MLHEIYENKRQRALLADYWADTLDRQVFVNLLYGFIGELQKQYTIQEIQQGTWKEGKFTPGRNLPHKFGE